MVLWKCGRANGLGKHTLSLGYIREGTCLTVGHMHLKLCAFLSHVQLRGGAEPSESNLTKIGVLPV